MIAMKTLSVAAFALLATLGVAQAQQEVEWKQTLTTPKGANVPRDRADILGIELGDTYAEALAKLRKLFDEGVQKKPSDVQPKPRRSGRMPEDEPEPIVPVKEEKNNFRYQPAGSALIFTANYVARLTMTRELKGVTDRPVDEKIVVFLSSPASGHQVIGIERWIDYRTNGDQPRVSEVLTQVSAKMKAQPHVYMVSDQGQYTFQFNDGKPVVPSGSGPLLTCYPHHTTNDAKAVPQINRSGDCDALFFIKVGFGISRDHAKFIQFVLSDNDRTKANLSADFAFVQDYIRGLGERTRGAPPKL